LQVELTRTAESNETKVSAALNSDIDDFKDAVQYIISQKANCTFFITRNEIDFTGKPDVLDPAEFMEKLKTPNPSRCDYIENAIE
jgi:hypothetical protein